MGKQSAWSSDLVHCHWHFSPIPEPIVEPGGGGGGGGGWDLTLEYIGGGGASQ